MLLEMNPELVFEDSERTSTTWNTVSEPRNLLPWRKTAKQFPHRQAKAQCIPAHLNCVFLKDISWELSNISAHFRGSVNVNTVDLRAYESWTLHHSSLDPAYVWSKNIGINLFILGLQPPVSTPSPIALFLSRRAKAMHRGIKWYPGFLSGGSK